MHADTQIRAATAPCSLDRRADQQINLICINANRPPRALASLARRLRPAEIADDLKSISRCAIFVVCRFSSSNRAMKLRNSVLVGLPRRGERITTGPQQEKVNPGPPLRLSEATLVTRDVHYPKGNVGSPPLLITHFLHTLA